jgi:Zn-dependent metalloprotease
MTKRRKAIVAVTAGLATISLGLSSTSAAGATPEANPSGLKLIKTKTSLLGTHYWYQQTFKGLPVINGYYAKHVAKDGTVQIADGRDAVPASLDVSAKVPQGTATQSANAVV